MRWFKTGPKIIKPRITRVIRQNRSFSRTDLFLGEIVTVWDVKFGERIYHFWTFAKACRAAKTFFNWQLSRGMGDGTPLGS